MKCVWGPMAAGFALVMLVAPDAQADAIRAPPKDCPPGSQAVSSHNGSWCEATTCTSDATCTNGGRCVEQALCVVTEEYTLHSRIAPRPGEAPKRATRHMAKGTCSGPSDCSAPATCVSAKRCVGAGAGKGPPSTPPVAQAFSLAPTAPPAPTDGGAPRPDPVDKKSCACEAVGLHGAGSNTGALAMLAFCMLAYGRRRGSR